MGLVRNGLRERGTFEQPWRGQGVSHVAVWGKYVSGTRKGGQQRGPPVDHWQLYGWSRVGGGGELVGDGVREVRELNGPDRQLADWVLAQRTVQIHF